MGGLPLVQEQHHLERKTTFSYFITGTDDDPSHSRLGVKGLGRVDVLLG